MKIFHLCTVDRLDSDHLHKSVVNDAPTFFIIKIQKGGKIYVLCNAYMSVERTHAVCATGIRKQD